jgi:hypothetical protein
VVRNLNATEISTALAVATAVNALRLKHGRLVGTREGVEIHQRGKPVLLLTNEAARQFAQEIEEAEA